ncbi:hypothetical protein HYQ45_003931 [Verticillium longisporum]|uniref:Uncharacterized protein n=1 Tax=Verticillium longisporum TaxID=100787 RepID=A0A8I3ATG0_VERLO|nr:hypothetical protein HYQ45_003931 [Verticillium longisporum]
MEKQNFMQIASSFYDAVQDQDNASKPNSKDLSFVAMCMNPTRTRAEVDFLYSDVERRLEIIKSIHDYISSTGSELATEIWKSVQIASFWAFLFTISVQQLVDIEIFFRNNSSPDRVSLEMRLFLLQTEPNSVWSGIKVIASSLAVHIHKFATSFRTLHSTQPTHRQSSSPYV